MVRHRLRCVAVVSLTGAALALGASATAGADSDWRGFKFLGTRCVRVGAQGEQIAARVRVKMIVHNRGIGRHWASNMRVKARLVHPGSGFDYTSEWRTVRYPSKDANPDELLQDHDYAPRFTVVTDGKSAAQDWRLQIKLIWDRKVPFKDVVEKFETNFNESGCADGLTPVGGYT